MSPVPRCDSNAAIPSGSSASGVFADLSAALAPHGLIIRGGFHPLAGEVGHDDVATVILIGNAGAAMWGAFAPHIDGTKNPLDRWTKQVIDPIAVRFGAHAAYPFGPDLWPFQRWALRAESVHASPLGILIHSEYGLWHSYRAALFFSQVLDLPQRPDRQSPCDTCAAKPCLSACPAGAFNGRSYDLPACANHLSSPEADCGNVGCHARNACPVGKEWRYPDAQIRFHMAAFSRTVLKQGA
jgi:hypothetical protein